MPIVTHVFRFPSHSPSHVSGMHTTTVRDTNRFVREVQALPLSSANMTGGSGLNRMYTFHSNVMYVYVQVRAGLVFLPYSSLKIKLGYCGRGGGGMTLLAVGALLPVRCFS